MLYSQSENFQTITMKGDKHFVYLLHMAMWSCICVASDSVVHEKQLNASNDKVNPLELAQQEHEWIHKHPTVNVGVKSGWMPIEFRLADESNRSVSLDYLHDISKLTGLKFNLTQHNGNHLDTKNPTHIWRNTCGRNAGCRHCHHPA